MLLRRASGGARAPPRGDAEIEQLTAGKRSERGAGGEANGERLLRAAQQLLPTLSIF